MNGKTRFGNAARSLAKDREEYASTTLSVIVIDSNNFGIFLNRIAKILALLSRYGGF